MSAKSAPNPRAHDPADHETPRTGDFAADPPAHDRASDHGQEFQEVVQRSSPFADSRPSLSRYRHFFLRGARITTSATSSGVASMGGGSLWVGGLPRLFFSVVTATP